MPRRDIHGLAAALLILVELSPARAQGDGRIELIYPLGRGSHAAVYDPIRHRMVVFGGVRDGLRNDTWVFQTTPTFGWSRLQTLGSPPSARSKHTLVRDPVRDRAILIGGFGDSTLSDVWALDFSSSDTWSRLTPTGTPPTARGGHGAIYDPIGDRVIVFGGSDGTVDFNDVWALTLSGTPAWVLLSPAGAPPIVRRYHSMIYDPDAHRVVMYGGYHQVTPSTFQRFADLWQLTLSGTPAWSLIGTTGTAPGARYEHTAIHDPIRQRMLIFGGNPGGLLDALSLTGTPNWSQPTPSGTAPPGGAGQVAVYDPDADRMIIFGAGTWELALSGGMAWREIPDPNRAPVRNFAAAAYDSLGLRMIMTGGSDTAPRNDVWQLGLATPATPLWSTLTPADSLPNTRTYHTLVFDSARNRMLLFGGLVGSTLKNDVWALDLAGPLNWIPLSPAGSLPPARWSHCSVYDPARDRMLVYGGRSATGTLGDVRALSLSGTPTWSAISPSGTTPSSREGASMIYDPIRDRLVLFGGASTSFEENDTWALSLAGVPAWTRLTTSGVLPVARYRHAAVYDSRRDRMVISGGHDMGLGYGDVWALPLQSLVWRRLLPTGNTPRATGHVSVYDPLLDRIVIAGSEGYLYSLPLTHIVTASAGPDGTISPLGVEPVAPGGSRTFAIAPNSCHHVVDVLVDGVSVGPVTEYTFENVQADHTISATFARDVLSIVAGSGLSGTISPSGLVSVDCGASQAFTIAANSGHDIADVLVDGVSVGPITAHTFSNVTAPHSIVALFVELPAPVEPFAITDGSVNAVLREGDRVFLGGTFTRVGPPSNGGAVVDLVTGSVRHPYGYVDGTVYCSVPDSSGGWFIGGTFTSVRGVARKNLAHILADGSVAAWAPEPDQRVSALGLSSGVVCAGGLFSTIAGDPWHPGFAMLDATTGELVSPMSVTPVASPVRAITTSSERAYVTGDFTHLGTHTGGWAVLDETTGVARPPFAGLVNGSIRSAVSDGSGGWYIGGTFTKVRGQNQSGVAHLLSDGTLAAWNPGVVGVDGSVYSLALAGNVLYMGGAFTSVGGQSRTRAAAVNAASGAVLAWSPNASGGVGTVRALVVQGSTVYAGGDFTSIGGQARTYLAALDATTGLAIASWNPAPNAPTNTLALSGALLYVGGNFSMIGGVSRSCAAVLDAATGAAQLWNPTATGGVVNAIVPVGSTVYVGGAFTNIGGQTRNRIAAVNTTNGAALAWNPNANGTVSALAVSGGTVYAGGSFTNIGTAGRVNLAALDASTGLAGTWATAPNGPILVLAAEGGFVHAGGQFSSVNTKSRTGLASLELATGQVTSWAPTLTGTVLTLAESGGVVHVGGTLSAVGGASRNNLAALDPATGLATAWNPNVTGSVRAIAFSETHAYIGGDFSFVGGVARTRLASVALSGGAVSSWNPTANSTVNALAISGTLVYAGGVFTSVGGQTRNRIAALDVLSGTPASWNPDATGTVETLALAGTDVYAGGSFAFMNSVARSNVACVDASTGIVTPWVSNANGAVLSLAHANGTLYMGGLFLGVSGVSRLRLAAVNDLTGAVTSWNPGASDGVYALRIAGNVLYAGGLFTTIAGQSRTRLAALELDTGAAIFWNPDPNGTLVRSIQVRDGTVYVGGDFTLISGASRNRAAAVDSSTGAALAWNPNVNGTVYAMDRLDGTMFLGGAFTAVGGQARSNLAAVDAITGSPTAWNPGATGTVMSLAAGPTSLLVGGAFTSLGGRSRLRAGELHPETGAVSFWTPSASANVNAVIRSGEWICLAGDFTTVGGRGNRSVAVIQNVVTVSVSPGGPRVPESVFLAQSQPNPASSEALIRYSISRAGPVSLRLFDVQGRLVRTLVPGTTQPAGHHEALVRRKGLGAGVYFYRLEANGRSLTRKLVFAH